MMNFKKYGKYARTILIVFLTVFLFVRYLHNKGRTIFIGKGDIIIHDIFPNKPKGVRFYDNVSLDMFNKSISIEGKHINHCSKMLTQMITKYTS